MINKENYEEYLCSYVDGELNDTEIKDLFQFLEQHPELNEELKVFESTKLHPDTTVVFENKQTLLKKEGAVILPIFNWKTLSAAAGLALLLGLGWNFWNGNTDRQIAITTTYIPNKKDTLKQESVQQEIAVVKEKKNKPIIRYQKPTIVPILTIQHDEIAAIQTKQLNIELPLPTTSKPEIIASLLDVPETNTTIFIETEKKNLFDLLHYDEEKKASMNEVAEAFSSKIEQAKSFSQNLKETTFALKLGSKAFQFNF